MPTYEYSCASCNKEFETIHSINTQLEECPTCKSKDVKRLISQSSFQLVGGGWAKDNYK